MKRDPVVVDLGAPPDLLAAQIEAAVLGDAMLFYDPDAQDQVAVELELERSMRTARRAR